MSTVALDALSLTDYVAIVGRTVVDEIRALATGLAGKSLVHVNSTSMGGGVAEILRRLAPLMQDIGLDVDWKVIQGDTEFFNVTKTFHNALQGMQGALTEDMVEIYLQNNEKNANLLDLDYDYAVVHDPQPAALIDFVQNRKGKWVWRCHIDLSQPNKRFWSFLKHFVLNYEAFIFSLKEYVKPPLEKRRVALIPPSIDPLSDKNKPLDEYTIQRILDRFDVDATRPILTQVARFDPWKDPLGVVDVYRTVKKKIPDVQLLLITSMAMDDPEGWTYYEKTARYAGDDCDIHLLTDLIGVGDLEVNAFQRAADVVLLKSIREGFGLTVAEALWKGTPVIGGNVGGIPLQIVPGETGFLVNTVHEAVEKTLHLLEHPQIANEMGRKGREHVKANFLITRHLKDYVKLLTSINHN